MCVSSISPRERKTSLDPSPPIPFGVETQEQWTVICCHLVAGMGILCFISIFDNLN